ncbi:peptidoglycan-binding domain-containing protein [Flavobacterium hercynium]|uniref:Uncharacterized protein n=1 Tax=Flavobacterium hercynium TaxID=387094 RepID=A0A226HA94_9FLAO|nr:peptidoglycan-binding domain-containing protein [Flavobacterium hercynium]OXA91249.1 hypothetical protein B0A66_11780 [Flavobacterium hercynium]SMP12362.1 hypothetical protein SAMN06265346_103233 [Flavobacterium hercynium]
MEIKIIGNLTPEVGIAEKYTVEKVLEAFDTEPLTLIPEYTDAEITWSIYVLDANVWRLAKGREQKGKSVEYKFSEISLKFKDIAMIVEAYGKETMIHIKPQPTSQPKITFIELLDENKKTPKKSFTYGNWIIARVHCVGMELRPIVVTLVENDGDKHKLNTKNLKIDTQKKFVKRGFADIKFYLDPMHANLANSKADKGESDEGKFHEYYVTAEIAGKEESRRATLDTHVANPDYVEKKLVVSPTIGFPVREVINSLMMVDMTPQTWWPFKEENCGGKYCIKKGDKNELIREINIRLAGFGGNVPTDEFTERTERMIKQFQRDYMKVPETGRICGNVLNAIDEFQRKYIIHFDDIKCKCKKCKGFGNELYKSVYKRNKPKKEAFHDYEYPGIHRSLVWLIRSIMFYTSVIEKDLGYELKCIFSGYRCWEDNKFNGRSSTNHMGKALDIHFSKNDKKVYKLNQIEEIRDKIILPYTNAQIRWEDIDLFSVEPSRKSYPKEFIATTWIHIDVREFASKYLENIFFVKTIEEINGKNIVELAKQLGFNDTCKCDFNNSNPFNLFKIINRYKENHFTIEDAELSLKKINKKYGKEMARNIEMMYRWECEHFNSGQYKSCGSPGMEVSEGAKGPEYGWNGDLYEKYPEYTPIGLWSEFENKGKSGLGGNTQITDRKKKYIVFPSVDAGMHYVAEFILRHNGNIGRWHSLYDKDVQNNYIRDINSTIPRISNKF